MRMSNIFATAAVAGFCLLVSTSAFAEREGREGPLPVLGLSLLGQLGSAVGGACLVWRRRRKAATTKTIAG